MAKPLYDAESTSEYRLSFDPEQGRHPIPDTAGEALAELEPIWDVCFQLVHGDVDPEPRTLEGQFPGNRNRAMGHALSLIEDLHEAGIPARREYVGKMDNFDLHRIDIHICQEDGETPV